MLNEFVFYAVLLGAVIFGVTWLLSKELGLAWLVTAVLGLSIIIFIFPSPINAKTLGDIATNLTLVIQKAVCTVGLAIGAFLLSLLCEESHER